ARASTLKADAETAKLQVDRRISDIEAKYIDNLKRFEVLLTQKDAELRVQQIQTQKTEQRRNVEEAELASARKAVESVNARWAVEVGEPLIPVMHESTLCSVDRRPENCGMKSLISPRSTVPAGYLPGYRT